jgi:ribosomal protein S18 acetylase RimI-like enzyme
LLARCEERGPTFAREQGITGEKVALAYVAHVNQRDRAVAEQAGFQPGQYYFQMRIDLSIAPPEPTWPEGVSVRPFVVEQDERAVYELIQSAFARPGRTPPTFEQWSEFMMRPDIFEAGLWFLAHADQELAGACLCFPYSSGGWVRQLAVAEYRRRQGIGAALLRQAFGEFKRRGFDTVGLSVESERPDAYKFYQRVGMTPARQYDEYVKQYSETP